MAQKVCVCGSSALEQYRSSRRLLPEVLSKPRTGKLDGCGVMPPILMREEMHRLGVHNEPFHILVSTDEDVWSRSDIKRHRRMGKLPYRSLLCVAPNILVTSPEMTFIDLAREKPFDEIELALIGYELCGTYLLDSSWEGLTNTESPLTKVSQIERMTSSYKGGRGIGHAKQALELVHDGSNSPMESVLCALLTFPRRLGGYALGPVALNYHVAAVGGSRYIDIAFPEHKVGLEYKGREYHSIERVGRDDRRQNEIVGSGWTIFNVWYEDLHEAHLFERLVGELTRAMGKRLRFRGTSFESKSLALRARLLPTVMKYESNGGT